MSLTPDDDAEHWRDQIAHDAPVWGDDPSEVSAGARGWLGRSDEVPTARGTDIDPLLAEALAPALRDLANTCAVSLEVRNERWASAPMHSAMVWEPSGSGTGIYVDELDSLIERVATAADRIQSTAIEALWYAGLPVTWPECPRHPRSHPLAAEVVDERSVWRCPATGEVVAEIGTLPLARRAP